MTRTKQSRFSPKLARKAEKALSKQALKEGRIDRESIISQSFWYRRQLVRNTISLNPNDYEWTVRVGENEVVVDKPKLMQKGRPTTSTRRNPGRMDGSQWNSQSIICPSRVETEQELSDIGSDSEEEDDPVDRPNATTMIMLIDIAKQMKPKGIAKEFEIVEKPRHVIALDDDDDDRWGAHDEEWEDVYEEAEYQRPYSAVLKGSGG